MIVLALVGGIVLRLLWLAQVHGDVSGFRGMGEATRTALSIAKTGSFADAYYPGSGPTAHLMPAMPWIAGGLFRAFGPASAGASLALLAWSLAQSFCGYLLLARLFRRLGADPVALKLAIILLCLVPVFAPQETIDFRYWEGAATVCLVCLNLTMMIDIDQAPGIGTRTMTAIDALPAVTFFVNPTAGLAIDACWAMVALRRFGARDTVTFAAISALMLMILIVPWTVRNADAVGAPIPLRSNFGLEIALANHDAALGDTAPEQILADRLSLLHPLHGDRPAAAMRTAGGEVAYSRGLGDATWRWIVSHPGGFVRLYARHLSEFLLPRPWQMYFSGWEAMRDARAIMISLVSLIGLAGLIAGLVARRRGYAMLTVYVVGVALPYGLVQPVPRYSYVVFGLLVFLASDAVIRALRYARPGAP